MALPVNCGIAKGSLKLFTGIFRFRKRSECCAMTVEIRQAGAEWLVEVHGEPIGTAPSAVEALELAVYWERRLDWVAAWRVSQEMPPLPDALSRILSTGQLSGRNTASFDHINVDRSLRSGCRRAADWRHADAVTNQLASRRQTLRWLEPSYAARQVRSTREEQSG